MLFFNLYKIFNGFLSILTPFLFFQEYLERNIVFLFLFRLHVSTYMQVNAFHVIRRISFKHTRRTFFLPSHIHMIKDAPAILPGHSHI